MVDVVGRGMPKARVNFIRLASAVERAEPPTEEESEAHAQGEQMEPPPLEQYWRRLEAYAVRMRELLDEIRVNDPRVAEEYGRTLSIAASKADGARKAWQQAGLLPPEGPRGSLGAERGNSMDSQRSLPPPPPEAVPSLASTMVGQSAADRRALLLGEAGGKGVRMKLGKGGAGAAQVLAEDRRMQERLESELTGLTRRLKGSVQAMHSTLVADNRQLDQIDSDVQKGQEKLVRVNTKVDDQRKANRRTTCVQCLAFLVVISLFFGTFIMMQLFSKATIREAVATPTISPPGGEHLTHPSQVRLRTATNGAVILYTLDGSDPGESKDAKTYSDKHPLMLGEHVEAHHHARKPVKVRVYAIARKPKFQDSAVSSAVFSFVPRADAKGGGDAVGTAGSGGAREEEQKGKEAGRDKEDGAQRERETVKGERGGQAAAESAEKVKARGAAESAKKQAAEKEEKERGAAAAQKAREEAEAASLEDGGTERGGGEGKGAEASMAEEGRAREAGKGEREHAGGGGGSAEGHGEEAAGEQGETAQGAKGAGAGEGSNGDDGTNGGEGGGEGSPEGGRLARKRKGARGGRGNDGEKQRLKTLLRQEEGGGGGGQEQESRQVGQGARKGGGGGDAPPQGPRGSRGAVGEQPAGAAAGAGGLGGNSEASQQAHGEL